MVSFNEIISATNEIWVILQITKVQQGLIFEKVSQLRLMTASSIGLKLTQLSYYSVNWLRGSVAFSRAKFPLEARAVTAPFSVKI